MAHVRRGLRLSSDVHGGLCGLDADTLSVEQVGCRACGYRSARAWAARRTARGSDRGPSPTRSAVHGSRADRVCRLVLVQQGLRWVAADQTALEKSVACGLAAATDKHAFWTFKQYQGIDSWVAWGLLGTTDGVLFRFIYDSAPCGGPGCSSRISFDRCDKPIASTNSHGRSELLCGR